MQDLKKEILSSQEENAKKIEEEKAALVEKLQKLKKSQENLQKNNDDQSPQQSTKKPAKKKSVERTYNQELLEMKKSKLHYEILYVNAERNASFYKWATYIIVKDFLMKSRELYLFLQLFVL